MFKQKPSLKWVALCSAAVLTVGGFTAIDAMGGISAQAQAAKNTKTTAVKSHPVHHHPVKHQPAKHQQTKGKTQTAVSKQKYKDGTYTGIGQTPIGAIEVAVTLKQDKITKAQVIGSSTHYPVSFIDPILPQQLIARQDINKIDIVSGATLSTADFYYAVVYALKKAQQAEITASHSTTSPKHA